MPNGSAFADTRYAARFRSITGYVHSPMSQTDTLLSGGARQIIAEVVAQFERRQEAVRGVCAVSESKQIKHGAFGPASSVEKGEQRLDDPEANAEEEDLLPMLSGDEFKRHELPSHQSNELRVRAVRLKPSEAEAEVPGADFTFQKDPAELKSVIVHSPELSGLAGFLMEPVESEITFEQVNGIPLTSEMRMRMRSRGIGRFRFDQEIVITARYKPCT